jgi:Zinc finger, ZZ type
MCIFIGRVDSVTKTRILVARQANNRQLTVYENVASSESPKNAMILPVPSKIGCNIQLLDMSGYAGNLWKDLDSFFPEKIQQGHQFAFGGGFVSKGGFEPLPVQRVGGYTCSIVPTLVDFVRVARETFTLPTNIEQVLQTHYGTGFSFVVCIFDRNVAAHPIAYTSARLPSGQCFIPTRHAHGGDDASHAAAVSHADVRCDGCGMSPIMGNRWKCSRCPNYDYCNTCYASRDQLHSPDHLFLHIPRPLRTNHGYSDDLFDHTLYLLDAVLVAGPASYTTTEVAKITSRQGGWGFGTSALTGLNAIAGDTLGEPSFITKVRIRGNYENTDHVCAPVAQ